MDPADFSKVAVEALYLALLLSAPALVVTLVVGVAAGLFQSVTNIHEHALGFVPKLVGVVLVLTTFGGFLGSQLVRFTSTLWQALPSLFP